MQKNPRLIVCAIPSLHVGGMERVMSILLTQFKKLEPDIAIHLVMFGLKPEIFYQIPDSITIHKPDFVFKNGRISRVWFTLRTIFFIRKTINSLNPCGILSFGERWNNLVLLAGIGRNWPVFVSDRCQPDKSLGFFQDMLRKRLYPKSKGVISQTSHAKEIFMRLYRHNNMTVIGNPIKQAIEIKKHEKEQIVLNVGRLIDTKHQDALIRLFVGLNLKDWKLVIVGGDALKQDNFRLLNNLIIELNASEKVQLTGAITNIEEWYQKAQIFAFPSSSEGFPNVIGEALSYGLPVVAFDCVAGPRDLIENGKNGYLTELMDFKSFSKNLQSLIENPDLLKEMSEFAQKSVQKFDEENIAKQFLTEILA